jgi:hypothetical protein
MLVIIRICFKNIWYSKQAQPSSHIFSGILYQQPHPSDSDSLWSTIYVKCSHAHTVIAKPLRNFTPLCLWRQTTLYFCIFYLHYLTRKSPLCGVTLSPYFVKRDNPHIYFTEAKKEHIFKKLSFLLQMNYLSCQNNDNIIIHKMKALFLCR